MNVQVEKFVERELKDYFKERDLNDDFEEVSEYDNYLVWLERNNIRTSDGEYLYEIFK